MRSPVAGISLLVARDVRVGGDSVMVRDGQVFLPEEEMPGYLADVVKMPSVAPMVEAIKSDAAPLEIETAFVVSHPNSWYYGHFVAEIAPKLALVKRYYDGGQRIPIFVGRGELPFVTEFIRLAIPDAVIVSAPEGGSVLVRHCLLPSQCRHYMPNAFQMHFFDDLARRCLAETPRRDFPKKIVISRRSIVRTFRVLENFDELEGIALLRGYVSVKPEDFSLREQICLFAGASHVLGEYGSAMHGAIFAPSSLTCISMNWINLVQQAIGLARGQPNIFILPSDGHAVVARNVLASPAGVRRYAIPPELVTATLEQFEK